MQDVIYLIGQALDVAVEARFPVLKAFLAFGLTSAPRSDSFAEFVESADQCSGMRPRALPWTTTVRLHHE